MTLAIKCIKQSCSTGPLMPLMETFRCMVNDCIRIGIKKDVHTRIKLTKLCYHKLDSYRI